MNTQIPELIALCRKSEGREGEDGAVELAGWAMLLPETEQVVAYVPDRTGTSAGMLNTFSSLSHAARILGHVDLYPVTDLSTLPSASR